METFCRFFSKNAISGLRFYESNSKKNRFCCLVSGVEQNFAVTKKKLTSSAVAQTGDRLAKQSWAEKWRAWIG